MLTIEDKKDVGDIVEKAIEKVLGIFAISVKHSFDECAKKEDLEKFATKEDLERLRLEMATKQDIQDLRQEFSVRYENRLDRHTDDIRIIKTKLKLA